MPCHFVGRNSRRVARPLGRVAHSSRTLASGVVWRIGTRTSSPAGGWRTLSTQSIRHSNHDGGPTLPRYCAKGSVRRGRHQRYESAEPPTGDSVILLQLIYCAPPIVWPNCKIDWKNSGCARRECRSPRIGRAFNRGSLRVSGRGLQSRRQRAGVTRGADEAQLAECEREPAAAAVAPDGRLFIYGADDGAA
jgi:hypothetical protein